jgi:ubiquinone/menaquinone biosynthesis C-methylase UbiE
VQNPHRILSPYIKNGNTVVDIGCGMGNYTIPMARMVGHAGKVFAVDLQDKMLEGVRKHAQVAGVSDRIITTRAPLEDIASQEQVDFALTFWMLHEVPDQKEFLGNIYKLLKSEGTYLFVEPKVHVTRSAFQDSLRIAESIGFTIAEYPKVFFSYACLLKKTI